MLFDTHSPRRRRAVQITFGFLALLMGGGLVFFGIGSSGTTGILDNVGNGSSNSAKTFQKAADKATAQLAKNPKDEKAAADLAKADLNLAQTLGYDPQTGVIQKDGQQYIDAAKAAWQKYLDLGPDKPNAALALQYQSVFLVGTNADVSKAARAVETALQTRKNSGLYGRLAVLQLYAGDNTQYRLARNRALALAPSADRRKAIAAELDAYEKQYKDALKKQAKATEKAAKTTPSAPTLPGLTVPSGLN